MLLLSHCHGNKDIWLYGYTLFKFVFYLDCCLISPKFIQKLVNILNRAKDKEVMVLKATFNNISVISRSQYYSWGKLEYHEKTTDLPRVTQKRYHIMRYRIHITISGIRTHSFRDDRH